MEDPRGYSSPIGKERRGLSDFYRLKTTPVFPLLAYSLRSENRSYILPPPLIGIDPVSHKTSLVIRCDRNSSTVYLKERPQNAVCSLTQRSERSLRRSGLCMFGQTISQEHFLRWAEINECPPASGFSWGGRKGQFYVLYPVPPLPLKTSPPRRQKQLDSTLSLRTMDKIKVDSETLPVDLTAGMISLCWSAWTAGHCKEPKSSTHPSKLV